MYSENSTCAVRLSPQFHFYRLVQFTPLFSAVRARTCNRLNDDSSNILDNGSRKSTRMQERITSFDHARYVNGSSITVRESIDSTAFETLVPGNILNPSDVTLNKEQKGVGLALEFEDKESFFVRIDNFARSKRAVLITGITTLNWPELLPAPTPAPMPALRTMFPRSRVSDGDGGLPGRIAIHWLRALMLEWRLGLTVLVDHVGSEQMQDIRVALKGKAEVLMGKNTMIRKGLQIGHNEYPDAGVGQLRAYMRATSASFSRLTILWTKFEMCWQRPGDGKEPKRDNSSLMLIWYCHRDRLVWIHLRRVSSSCSVLEQRLSRARSN